MYACIAYMVCIIYLIFQGVGDGSQPLISRCYGERDFVRLKSIRRLVYTFAMLLAVVGCVIMYLMRGSLGLLFGTSGDVNTEVARIIPIFLISVPFVAVTHVTTASFYASEKSAISYLLTFIEPVLFTVGALAWLMGFAAKNAGAKFPLLRRGTPGATRTHYIPLRRRTLYPGEVRGLMRRDNPQFSLNIVTHLPELVNRLKSI